MELIDKFVKQFKARDKELDDVDYECQEEFIIENDGIVFSLQIYMWDDVLKVSLSATQFMFKGERYNVDDFSINWEYDESVTDDDQISLVVDDIYTEINHCDIKSDFDEVVKIMKSLKRDLTESQFLILEELVKQENL